MEKGSDWKEKNILWKYVSRIWKREVIESERIYCESMYQGYEKGKWLKGKEYIVKVCIKDKEKGGEAVINAVLTYLYIYIYVIL